MYTGVEMNNTLSLVVILVPILLISMSIHEMMHAYVSNWLGDDTARLMGRVSINPIAHMDPMLTLALPILLLITSSPILFGAAKPVQVNFSSLKYEEYGGAIVGMVGPLTNLALAFVAGLLFTQFQPEYGTTLYSIFKITIWLNVGLFIFNSIPWPPLDGSRLLYAFAPTWLQEFMSSLERMGLTSIVILIFIFMLVGNPIGLLAQKLVGVIAPGLVF